MHLITSSTELAEACAAHSAGPYIAVDTEFMREQTYWPHLCLIQMAGPNGAHLVDPLASGIDLAPFFALMGDRRVLKVFHAARQDVEIVHYRAGLIPEPLFDTQVAAMVCGFGQSISYVNLVRRVTGVDIDKSSRFTDWSRRPLNAKQLTYALGDVTHLRPVYEHLAETLERTGRARWVEEEMRTLTDPATYDMTPEESWRRLKLRVRSRKSLGVLMELAAWRERAAQTQNVPRARILRDEVLYDIANQMPATLEDLGRLRSLSEGFARSQRAREIVETVKRGLERDPKTVPSLNGGRDASEPGAIVDMLRVLLKAAASRHGVAPRLIADSEDLERIAGEDAPDVPALKGWRREMFGADAERLKRGEIALVVRGGNVVTIEIKGGAAQFATSGDAETMRRMRTAAGE